MKKKTVKRLTPDYLRKIGVKEVLIPGLLLASVLGWRGWETIGPNFYKNKQVFPYSGVVRQVEDNDTFQLQSGVRVRLIGIDAPNRGDENTPQSGRELKELVNNEKIWLEYDRYQDDKYGRVLAWVWYECEGNPKFTPADYMHLSNNQSREGLMKNPVGCQEGKLLQEELVKQGLVWVQVYKDRGELKYEKRLLKYNSENE